jgi:hypothetical protein
MVPPFTVKCYPNLYIYTYILPVVGRHFSVDMWKTPQRMSKKQGPDRLDRVRFKGPIPASKRNWMENLVKGVIHRDR